VYIEISNNRKYQKTHIHTQIKVLAISSSSVDKE